MEWYWAALGLWYLGLVHVIVWNLRSRATWDALDAYPLRFRIRLLLPFTRTWQRELRSRDASSLPTFRRRFLIRFYGVVILPPLLLFGWLYTTTYIRYENAVERRQRLEMRLEEIVAERERAAAASQREHPSPGGSEPQASEP